METIWFGLFSYFAMLLQLSAFYSNVSVMIFQIISFIGFIHADIWGQQQVSEPWTQKSGHFGKCHSGEFLDSDNNRFDILCLDSVPRFGATVAIVSCQNCDSSAEKHGT